MEDIAIERVKLRVKRLERQGWGERGLCRLAIVGFIQYYGWHLSTDLRLEYRFVIDKSALGSRPSADHVSFSIPSPALFAVVVSYIA